MPGYSEPTAVAQPAPSTFLEASSKYLFIRADWDRKTYSCPSTNVVMSMSFLKASLEHFCSPPPAIHVELLLPVLCPCVLQARLHLGLSSMLGFAAIDWFFAVDTLPRPLFLNACFAVVVAQAYTLLPRLLRAPPHDGS